MRSFSVPAICLFAMSLGGSRPGASVPISAFSHASAKHSTEYHIPKQRFCTSVEEGRSDWQPRRLFPPSPNSPCSSAGTENFWASVHR